MTMLLYRHIDSSGCGSITVEPRDPEDMWHIYNLIEKGDRVYATTFRKIQTQSATGSVDSQRIKMQMEVAVESVRYDCEANVLCVKGRNCTECEHVKLGAYHTVDLELHRKFRLAKAYWDVIAMDRLSEATDIERRAEIGAIVLHEGLAHVCLVTSTSSATRQRIDVPMPKKRKGATSQHDKALARFYELVAQAAEKYLNLDTLKCVLIASPAFVNEQLLEVLLNRQESLYTRKVVENRQKIVLVHASSGHKHALAELFADAGIMQKLSETRAANEMRVLTDFNTQLRVDSTRAVYGMHHVRLAASLQAIETLLICDELFRSRKDTDLRKKCAELITSVRNCGGTVYTFSSLHVSGQQLLLLTGVAAVLRFPLPDDLLESSEATKSDSDSDDDFDSAITNLNVCNSTENQRDE